jgi:Na+-driven multidrug efflux pump
MPEPADRPAALPSSLPRMAVPLVISFTLRFLFSTIDLVYARLLGDQSAVAAIGFYIPFQGVYIALWVGLSAGFTAALSNAFGHRDEGRIRALKAAMLRIQQLLIPLLSLGGVAIYLLVPRFGLDEGLTRAFSIYGTTLLVGMPLTGFWSIFPDSVVKAHHDTRSTMMAGICATVTNVALNTLFVFGFGWGIFGIAFATVLSRLAALGYALRRARVREAERQRDPGWLETSGRTWPGPVLAIVALGLPAALTYGLTAAEGALVNVLLADLPDSTTAIASYGVYHALLMLALMPTVATSVAVLPYVARLVPEGHHAHVARDLRVVSLLAAAFGLVFTIPAGLLFPEVFARLVPGDGDVPVAPLTVATLRLLPLAALSSLPFLLLRPVFEAIHEPRLGVYVSVLRFVVLSFPLVITGRHVAVRTGFEPLLGIVAGLVTASFGASVVTASSVRRRLRRAAAGASAPGPTGPPGGPPSRGPSATAAR